MLHDQLAMGLGLAAGGGMLVWLRDLPAKLWGHVRDRIVFTFELDDSKSCHNWLRRWLALHATSRFVSADAIHPEPSIAATWSSAKGGASRRKPRFFLYPRGLCWFRYEGRRFLAWSSKEPLPASNGYRETITLRCLGDGRAVVQSLLSEAYDVANGNDGRTIEVWVPEGRDWRMSLSRVARPIASLALQPEAAAVLDDARRFLASRWRYDRLGIPFRRGYLFHGPPGNGKSSLALVIASELGMNLSVLSVSACGSDACLIDCASKVPPGHVVLMEDVDAAWNGREAIERGVGVTFSGLLNAIDGPTAQDGRILIMTTNHRDKLDPALIRPGRADLHVEFPNATAPQAAELYCRFFPDAHPFEALSFGKSAAGHSLAKIQEELLGWSGLSVMAVAA